MAVNKSARGSRILVGGSDYSTALVEASDWQSSPLSQSGLITTTASVRLGTVRNLPGSLDDRSNNLWRIGQTVTIDVANSIGTLKRHPAGTLRILSSEYDVKTATLTLRCGCLLSLLNFKAPTNSEEAEIDYENFTARTAIVTKLLKLAGITKATIPALPYPINYPLRISGSYIETVGKLLYSAGYVGWIDDTETFRVKPVSFTATSTISLQIGGDTGDELWYERLTSAEAPREIIKVNGVRPVAQLPEYPKNYTTTRYSTATQVDPSLDEDDIVISKEVVEEDYNDTTKKLTITRDIYTPRGLALPSLKHEFPTSLIQSEKRTEIKEFESTGKEGKLLKVEVNSRKLSGAVLAEYIAYLQSGGDTTFATPNELILAERSLSYHDYDIKNRPTQIETYLYQTEAELLSNTNHNWEMEAGIPSDRKLSSIQTETWEHRGGREWQHQVYAKKTLGKLAPEAIEAALEASTDTQDIIDSKRRQRKLALAHDSQSSLIEISNSGQTVPPAPERHPPKVNYEEKQVCGEATFATAGGNPYKERERTYTIEYLQGKKQIASEAEEEVDYTTDKDNDDEECNDAQCKAIAQIEGKLLFGKFKGQDIGMDIKDSLFSWEPLMSITCTEPSGIKRKYLLDDAHWIIKQQECLCNFGCIWIGDVAAILPAVTIKLTAPAQLAAPTITVEPITAPIPAGIILKFGSKTVKITAPAVVGVTSIEVEPLESAIAVEVPANYIEELLTLPYVEVKTLTVRGRMMPYVEILPYAAVGWQLVSSNQWRRMTHLEWRSIA